MYIADFTFLSLIVFRSLCRAKRRWDDNIKMDPKVLGWEGVNGTWLSQYIVWLHEGQHLVDRPSHFELFHVTWFSRLHASEPFPYFLDLLLLSRGFVITCLSLAAWLYTSYVQSFPYFPACNNLFIAVTCLQVCMQANSRWKSLFYIFSSSYIMTSFSWCRPVSFLVRKYWSQIRKL
jgi:hypothetical protein